MTLLAIPKRDISDSRLSTSAPYPQERHTGWSGKGRNDLGQSSSLNLAESTAEPRLQAFRWEEGSHLKMRMDSWPCAGQWLDDRCQLSFLMDSSSFSCIYLRLSRGWSLDDSRRKLSINGRWLTISACPSCSTVLISFRSSSMYSRCWPNSMMAHARDYQWEVKSRN